MNTNISHISGQILGKVFNIAPHEVPRVLFAWLLKFLFMIGFTVGWTMLTAILVGRIGISYLPILYVANAVLVIGGAVFFGELAHRFSKSKLIYATILSGAILLGSAWAVFGNIGNLWLFLGLALLAESVFFAQLNIVLGLFIEDLFTPLESGRAFPLIESSEYFGGIAGGLLILGSLNFFRAEAADLSWIWIGAIVLIFPALWLFNRFRQKLPTLEFEEHATKVSKFEQFREGQKQIRKMPFLTGLVFVVLLQWTFLTLLNFQYTKAVNANLTHSSMTEVENESGKVQTTASHSSHEDLLTHGLGRLHIIFFTIALLTQLLLTSRVMGRFGIVKTLRLHPLASFGSALLMIAKPGFGSAVFAKGLFESTTGIFTAAYHSSFYALREKIRGSVKEFLEGLIRPAGVLLGTGILLVGERLLSGADFALAVNCALVTAAAAMSFLLFRHQRNYTKIPAANLQLFGNHPAKFQSIEVLSQPGHAGAAEILVEKLHDPHESPFLKIKILGTLGLLSDLQTVPAILERFQDANEEVRLAAVEALASFKNLDSKGFTHRRVLDALKELFAGDTSAELRSAIVRVFANLRQEEAVQFIIAELQNLESPIRGDCVYVCGQFKDTGITHYIEPYLKSPNLTIRANAIIALWQFQSYRLRLNRLLAEILEAQDRDTRKVATHTLGEIRAHHELPRLLGLLEEDDDELRLLAALALGKLENPVAHHMIAEFILHPNLELAGHAKKQLPNLPAKTQKNVEKILHHRLSEKLNGLLAATRQRTIAKISIETLAKIRRVYELADDWEEVAKIDAALAGQRFE
ncbi:MAG: HEAT repeat domain-containing protein [Patescibacteria group bacterium]